MPKVTTFEVGKADGSRQRQTRDLRDEDGAGTVVEQVLDFSSEGVRLVSLRIKSNFAGITNTYSFVPQAPPVVLRPGLRDGDRSEFILEGDGVTIRTVVTVGAAEEVRIEDQSVRAVPVTLESTFSGALTGTQRAVNRIDSSRGIPVREEVDSDVSNGSVRVRSNYKTSLKSLRPST
jgi:hypothetical protein